MTTSSKINNIIYGAVHDGHDFSYIGFCKKVHSDDIQSVDVWIDDKKVETLRCDKKVDKISNIYDKASFAFQYDLPDEYIGQKHLVSFICNGAELENSPFATITKDDDGYNECKLMRSLNIAIDEEKIKDSYYKNGIGFLAVDENLKDIEFMGYIRELIIRFPEASMKVFYFNEQQKKICENIFAEQLESLEFIISQSLQTIVENIEIYIFNSNYPLLFRPLFNILVNETKNIFAFQYFWDYKGFTIKEKDEQLSSHPWMTNLDYFGLKLENNSFYKTVYNPILKIIGEKEIDNNSELYEYAHYGFVSYALKHKKFKDYVYNLNKKHYQLMKVV